MADVLIMLATYNGEKYIREQIISVINQNYKDWNLVIRDDGSEDRTIDIISDYLKDPRIKLFCNKSGEHGYISNFKELVLLADRGYRYYMFCDQDDIWDTDKISVMLTEATKMAEEQPIIVQADMRIIDAKGEIVYSSFQKIYDMKVNKPFADVFFSNRTYGCNILFNAKLFSILQRCMKNEQYVGIGHDILSARIAATCDGSICFIDKSIMSYRRHDNNVTARQKYKISIGRIFARVLHFEKLAKDIAHTYDVSAKSIDILLDIDDINPERKHELMDIRKALKEGGLASIAILNKYKVSCGNRIRTISHWLILIMGAHRKFME